MTKVVGQIMPSALVLLAASLLFMSMTQAQVLQTTCNTQTCAAGQFQNYIGETGCADAVKDCYKGRYCPDDKGSCIMYVCPNGTYQDLNGQTACKQCPAGTYRVNTETQNVFQGGTLPRDITDCLVCPEGQYQDQPGQADCKECPTGTFRLNSGLQEPVSLTNTNLPTSCTDCTTTCQSGFKEVTPCTPTTDRVCQDDTKPTISCASPTVSVEVKATIESLGTALQSAIDVSDNADDPSMLLNTLVITGLDTSVVGTQSATFTVEDSAGNSNFTECDVRVEDTVEPSIQCSGVVVKLEAGVDVKTELDTLKATVDVSDAVDSESTLLSTLEVTGIDTLSVSTQKATFTINDQSGNKKSVRCDVEVVDETLPLISCRRGTTVILEAAVSIEDQMDILKTAVSVSDTVDNVATLLQSVMVTDLDVSTVGTKTATFTVEDRSGNSNVTQCDVNVVDTTAPVFNNVPEVVYVLNGNAFNRPEYTVTDTVDATEDLSVVETYVLSTQSPLTEWPACAGSSQRVNDLPQPSIHTASTDSVDKLAANGTRYSVTYNATDLSFNTGQAKYVAVVLDTEAPELSINGPAVDIVQYMKDGSGLTLPAATASDSHDGDLTPFVCASVSDSRNPTASFTLDAISSSAAPGTMFTAVYSVQDLVAHMVDATVVFEVRDLVSPVVTASPLKVTLYEGMEDWDRFVTFSADDDWDRTVTVDVNAEALDAHTADTYTVELSATDTSGNVGYQNVTVEIRRLADQPPSEDERVNINVDTTVSDAEAEAEAAATLAAYQAELPDTQRAFALQTWVGKTLVASSDGTDVASARRRRAAGDSVEGKLTVQVGVREGNYDSGRWLSKDELLATSAPANSKIKPVNGTSLGVVILIIFIILVVVVVFAVWYQRRDKRDFSRREGAGSGRVSPVLQEFDDKADKADEIPGGLTLIETRLAADQGQFGVMFGASELVFSRPPLRSSAVDKNGPSRGGAASAPVMRADMMYEELDVPRMQPQPVSTQASARSHGASARSPPVQVAPATPTPVAPVPAAAPRAIPALPNPSPTLALQAKAHSTYAGNISRLEAEQLLKPLNEGSYLLRAESQDMSRNTAKLSLKRSAGVIEHHILGWSRHDGVLLNDRPLKSRCASIQEVLAYLRTTRDGIGATLLYGYEPGRAAPPPSADIAASVLRPVGAVVPQAEGATALPGTMYHGQLTREEAEARLLAVDAAPLFLLRNHSAREFTLTVKTVGGQFVHHKFTCRVSGWRGTLEIPRGMLTIEDVVRAVQEKGDPVTGNFLPFAAPKSLDFTNAASADLFI
eukprot:m.118857 g.118857  ORF g.118857 m.118857 type:complete len:1299 (+) comp13667_c0_seq4:321-4217(+)